MVPLEAVTPTLYALAEAFAQRVLSERKDSVRQFLKHEEIIYKTAFQFYVHADQVRMAKDDCHRDFANYLRNNGILNDDEEKIRILSRPVHDEYWRMAQSDFYWVDGKRRAYDAIDEYSSVLGKWRKNETKRLEDKREFMNQLRSTIAG
jgi:hypothetical protein